MSDLGSAHRAQQDELSEDDNRPVYRDLANLLGGATMVFFGLWFGIRALNLTIGTTTNMGPGYFPTALSAIIIVIGLVIMYQGLRGTSDRMSVDWLPMVAVGASILAFAIGMRFFGLVPAITGTVMVAALADRDMKPLSALVLGLGMSLFSWLVFNKGLGLVMPPFKLDF